jgi:phosphate regulon transcriptional regulator PhoB
MRPRILLVEDDASLVELIRYNLEKEGFDVVCTGDGEEALVIAQEDKPDLVILDWMIANLSGIEVCRRLRRAPTTAGLPIVMLTARAEEADRIRGLETGADDYVTKPFSPRELVARVRAILKRAKGTGMAESLSRGRVALDLRSRLCRVSGEEVALTATEFDILARLMAEPDRLLSRPVLIAALWGANSPVSDRTLDSHLRNLRRKLAVAGCQSVIATVHGQGMRLGACG